MTVTPRNTAAAHLYVIGRAGGAGVVKIGRASKPASRLADLQAANPERLSILHVIPDAGHMEKLLHAHFADLRLGGEWFDFGSEDPVKVIRSAVEQILSGQLRVLRTSAPRPAKPSPNFYSWCRDCGTESGVISQLLDAAIQYFLRECPDPMAYLVECGFSPCCIGTVFKSLGKMPAA